MYVCHIFTIYKTLINYAQTHPKANEYLKEVMKESIGKMIKFTTESGMVASADINDVSKNTSTIKHRVSLVMGVPLRIVSSHQGTQKKKRYSRSKTKAEIAKRRKEQN
jgi:vacuolar-type H+-ATPase subunit D/Vma8